MYIKRIELKNYRNYESIEFDFENNVNLILGKNAQGKTNLLESLYVSSIGKSFRTNKDSELIKFNQQEAYIKIFIEKNFYNTTLEIKINNNSKKFIKKDNKVIKKMSDLLENLYIVIFSPEDLKIVKDEPEKRRKFIDRELCQIKPSYYENLVKYRKTLNQRNFCLKKDDIDKRNLEIWDLQLVEYGSKIIKMRNDFIIKINEFSKGIHKSITNGIENLDLIYEPNIKYSQENLISEEYYKKLNENIDIDIRNRNTSVGPHKDDISFIVDGVNMRSFGSQGQQRTCALSLKLAELDIIKEETGEDAVLLLDDVMSELDVERQRFLIKTLDKNQLFITTTEIDENVKNYFPDAKIIYIENGKKKIPY